VFNKVGTANFLKAGSSVGLGFDLILVYLYDEDFEALIRYNIMNMRAKNRTCLLNNKNRMLQTLGVNASGVFVWLMDYQEPGASEVLCTFGKDTGRNYETGHSRPAGGRQNNHL
jgi:hypothetical protein